MKPCPSSHDNLLHQLMDQYFLIKESKTINCEKEKSKPIIFRRGKRCT